MRNALFFFVFFAALLAGGCAGVVDRERPSEFADRPAAGVLADLEQRLLDASAVRFEGRIESTGLFKSRLAGDLVLAEGNHAAIAFDGHFAGRRVRLRAVSDGEWLAGGSGDEFFDQRTPPDLNRAVLVGFTRMGLLHNLARLTGATQPDHAGGGVTDWVRAEDAEWVKSDRPEPAMAFDIHVDGREAGRATLWLDPDTSLPVRREQTVEFSGGTMQVLEVYSSFELGVIPDRERFILKR